MEIIRESKRETGRKQRHVCLCANTSASVNHNKPLLLFQFIFNITHFYDFSEVLL